MSMNSKMFSKYSDVLIMHGLAILCKKKSYVSVRKYIEVSFEQDSKLENLITSAVNILKHRRLRFAVYFCINIDDILT
jgi:hypothetical protein